MPSNHLIFCRPFSTCPQSFPASGSFQMSQLFASGGQSIRVSASTSVLPMNIKDWSPLGWTGWISLLSKGLSRVFSNTTSLMVMYLDDWGQKERAVSQTIRLCLFTRTEVVVCILFHSPFHWVGDAIQPSHPLSSPSPPALNLSQHQGLFKWVSSSHHVAKILGFQLQHQSFQWTPRTDLL